jgi:hypothetical protein
LCKAYPFHLSNFSLSFQSKLRKFPSINSVADDNEFIGLTNYQGNLTADIDKSDLNYNRIVRAVAGLTSDNDVGGKVNSTYEMAAPSTADVISPFTTVAFARAQTIDELAAELNMDSKLLNGDYVAQKKDNQEAKLAHLIARSTVTTLQPSIADTLNDDTLSNNVSKLSDKAKTVTQDIDKALILLDSTGDAIQEVMRPTLIEFMDNKSYYSFSFNDFWLHECERGSCKTPANNQKPKWTFDITNDKVTLDKVDSKIEGDLEFGGKNSSDIRRDENSFYIRLENGERSEMQDRFVYLADDFAIALSIDDDLQLYLSESYGQNNLINLAGVDLTNMSFSQTETLHHLYDIKRRDMTNKPWQSQPEMKTVTIASVDDALNGAITVNDKPYKAIVENRDLLVVLAAEDNHPSILFKNRELAQTLSEVWTSSTSEQKPIDNNN